MAAYGFFPFHGRTGWSSFPSGHMTAITAPVSVLWARLPRWRPVLAIPVMLVASRALWCRLPLHRRYGGGVLPRRGLRHRRPRRSCARIGRPSSPPDADGFPRGASATSTGSALAPPRNLACAGRRPAQAPRRARPRQHQRRRRREGGRGVGRRAGVQSLGAIAGAALRRLRGEPHLFLRHRRGRSAIAYRPWSASR